MHSVAILLAVLAASNVLALPVDLQIEAARIDARTVGRRSATHNSIASLKSNGVNRDDDDTANTEADAPKALTAKRWITPPTTVLTGFGTQCSLETCDMCPTFPGCGSVEMKAGKASATEDWTQPPEEKRGESTAKAIDLKGDWEQPSRTAKREAYINPIVAGGVDLGVGPECNIYTCDMCPDHPGCRGEESIAPPK